MQNTMGALELTGSVDEHHCLHLDNALPVSGPLRVRVILLYPLIEDIDEKDWLRAAAHNPALDFLKDPEEDIYSLADGEPFKDKA